MGIILYLQKGIHSMASELNYYSLYKLQDKEKYYLLRTERPSFSNASQPQEDLAYTIENDKREYILEFIKKNFENESETSFLYIGEMEDSPFGDKLYEKQGGFDLNIYYLELKKPWILIGDSDSEEDFLNNIKEDEDYSHLEINEKPKKVLTTFITDSDHYFSKIDYFKIKDVRPTEAPKKNGFGIKLKHFFINLTSSKNRNE